jgi:hypothetical protein
MEKALCLEFEVQLQLILKALVAFGGRIWGPFGAGCSTSLYIRCLPMTFVVQRYGDR